jgi:arylsulfatase A-like enzyme
MGAAQWNRHPPHILTAVCLSLMHEHVIPRLARLVLLIAASSAPLAPAATRRPNVLILCADQHNADVMGCSGHAIVKTPNLDLLATQGVRFTRDPTLVDVVKLPRPADAPRLAGRSLAATLTEGKPTGRVYAVSENWSQVTVITDRYKLGTWIDPTARHPERDFGKKFPPMLFDREEDPQELVNLAGKPDYAAVEAQLRAYLAEWVGRTADDGKKAISALPVGTKNKNRKSKP